MSRKFKRIFIESSSDDEDHTAMKKSNMHKKSKSPHKETKKKNTKQITLELFGSDEEEERRPPLIPKTSLNQQKTNMNHAVTTDLILKNLQYSLGRYDVDINMYTKLSPELESQVKHMSFLLKVTLKHYKRTEETRLDYLAFKSSLNTPGLSRSVEEISSAKSEFETEQRDFISKLTERGSKFLSALKAVISVFKEEKKALTLAFVEVVKESVDGDMNKLTQEYIDECRSMCDTMLVRNQCLDFQLFFSTMHPTNFHRLVQKAIGLSQSRLVGSYTPTSTTSGRHELDYPYGESEPG